MQSIVEQWLPVVGFEGLYEISNWGRVRSLDQVVMRSDGRTRRAEGRILKPSDNGSGYLVVNLCKNGVRAQRKVHSLVAAAFIGPRPAGQQVRHGKNGKLDNRPENLSYGTIAENMADKLRDGTHTRGKRNGLAKLTEEMVLEARRLDATGPRGTLTRLARDWGVTQSALHHAVNGRSWSWLKGPTPTPPEPAKPEPAAERA